MLDVICPQCNAVYHSEESHAGKHLRCSRCGCLVAISTHAERAVVQQSSASDAASRQGSNPPAKHPTRRIRRVYAAIVFATAVTLLLLLLRFATPKRGTASLSDVEGTKQSQENPNANDTLDFQPGPAQSAEPTSTVGVLLNMVGDGKVVAAKGSVMRTGLAKCSLLIRASRSIN